MDREIADVVNEIISKHQACGEEMLRAASAAEAGEVVGVKLGNVTGTWLDVMGSMDKVLHLHAGTSPHSNLFLPY